MFEMSETMIEVVKLRSYDFSNSNSTPTTRIYCAKCRDNSAHYRAREKLSDDIFRQVEVTKRNNNGAYHCKCKACGHTWVSKSDEAASIYNAAPVS